MRFSADTRGTAGHTSGRSSRETMVSTGSGQWAVNGRRSSSRRRAQGRLEQGEVGAERHAQLVRRDRQAAFGDVEHALGRAAVVRRVVQHAVVQPVARDQLVAPGVAVDREGQLAREAVLVQHQRLGGKPDGLRERRGGPQAVDVVLDPAVGGAEVLGEQARLLAIPGEQVAGQPQDILTVDIRRDPGAHGRELEQDRADGGTTLRQPDRPVRPQSYDTLELHGMLPDRC